MLSYQSANTLTYLAEDQQKHAIRGLCGAGDVPTILRFFNGCEFTTKL